MSIPNCLINIIRICIIIQFDVVNFAGDQRGTKDQIILFFFIKSIKPIAKLKVLPFLNRSTNTAEPL